MAQEFIAFKIIPNHHALSLEGFKAYAESNCNGETRTVLEHMDNIDHLREQRHGCFLLKLKDGGSMMLPPSEAEKIIETLTRSYKK